MSSKLHPHSVILGPISFCEDHAGYAGWYQTRTGSAMTPAICAVALSAPIMPGEEIVKRVLRSVLQQKWRSGSWKPLRQEGSTGSD